MSKKDHLDHAKRIGTSRNNWALVSEIGNEVVFSTDPGMQDVMKERFQNMVSSEIKELDRREEEIVEFVYRT